MKEPPKPELTVTALGQCAWRLLAHADQVSVLGVTSKGVFLKTTAGDVCFLTQEGWHGPLTLNLREDVGLKALLQVGQRGRITGRGVDFPVCLVVVPEAAVIWEPKPIQMDDVNLSDALARGADLVRRLDTENSLFKGFFEAVAVRSWADANEALLAVLPGGEGQVLDRLSALLGVGGGLTPSGDDYLCGLLLARDYHHQNTPAPEEEARFVSDIRSQARARTTALSASLIACAAEGQADERLMDALAWLLTGAGSVEPIKKALLTYGSASGSDALAGMLASLLILQESPGD